MGGGRGHCGYRRYLYHQGKEQTTGGTVEAATKPWLIKSAPPAIPFDTPVPGMPRTSAVDNAREAMTTIMIMIMTMTMKQRTKVNDEDTDNDDDGNNNEK